jgi:hypothetical protein
LPRGLFEADEEGTLSRLKALGAETTDPNTSERPASTTHHAGANLRDLPAARCRLSGETSSFCNAKHDMPALDRA